MASAAPAVAQSPTAWQVVWAAIPEVQQAYPSGQPPDNAGVRKVQDLPAIHSLVVSSSRRADARGFSVCPGNLVAAMVQVSGVTHALPCRKCASAFGLWSGCVTNPAEVSEGYGVPARCCANCAYNRKSTGCRWTVGPVPALAGPPQAAHLPGGQPAVPPVAAPAVPAPAPAPAPLAPAPPAAERIPFTLELIEEGLQRSLEGADAEAIAEMRGFLGRIAEACDRAEARESRNLASEDPFGDAEMEDADAGAWDDDLLARSPSGDGVLPRTPSPAAAAASASPSVGMGSEVSEEEGEPAGRPLGARFGGEMEEFSRERSRRELRQAASLPVTPSLFRPTRYRPGSLRGHRFRTPPSEGRLPSLDSAERGPRYSVRGYDDSD